MKKSFLLVLILMLLAACAPVKSSPEPGISQEAAIEGAIRRVMDSRPEMSGAKETPSNPRAEKMTLQEAFQRLRGGSDVPADHNPGTPVWLVTLDGLWFSEPPCPICSSSPSSPLRHFSVILDAASGEEIASQASP